MKFLSSFFAFGGVLILISCFIFPLYAFNSFGLFNVVSLITSICMIFGAIFASKKETVSSLEKKITDLNSQSSLALNINTKLQPSSNLNIDEVEKLRQQYNHYLTLVIVNFVLAFVLGQTFIVPLICIPLAIFFLNKLTKIKPIIKAWIIENKLALPNLKDIVYIEKNNFNKIFDLLFIQKLYLQNTANTSVEIDDAIFFDYKGKTVNLTEFKTSHQDKERQHFSYLCLATSNPDKIEGETAAWSDNSWNFKLSEKVNTESTDFNNLFKVVSSGQIEARLHLKTNVMQGMIDLNQKLASHQTVFYFKDDKMYIIFKYLGNALEPKFNKPLSAQIKADDPLILDLKLALSIFDSFWLNRKITQHNPETDFTKTVSSDLTTSSQFTTIGKNQQAKTVFRISFITSIIVITIVLGSFTLIFGSLAKKNLEAITIFNKTQATVVKDIATEKECINNTSGSYKRISNGKTANVLCQYYKQVEYQLDGKTKTGKTDYGENKTGWNHDVGSKVDILYNPKNPDQIYFNDYSLWIPVIGTTAFLTLYIFLVIAILKARDGTFGKVLKNRL